MAKKTKGLLILVTAYSIYCLWRCYSTGSLAYIASCLWVLGAWNFYENNTDSSNFALTVLRWTVLGVVLFACIVVILVGYLGR